MTLRRIYCDRAAPLCATLTARRVPTLIPPNGLGWLAGAPSLVLVDGAPCPPFGTSRLPEAAHSLARRGSDSGELFAPGLPPVLDGSQNSPVPPCSKTIILPEVVRDLGPNEVDAHAWMTVVNPHPVSNQYNVGDPAVASGGSGAKSDVAIGAIGGFPWRWIGL